MATTKIEKRSGDAGAGGEMAKAAREAAAGPPMAECRRIATQLKMVADGARVAILLALAEGERDVSHLTTTLSMTQPGVSHHLALLKMTGVVAPRRDGHYIHYSLTDDGRALAAVVRSMLG